MDAIYLFVHACDGIGRLLAFYEVFVDLVASLVFKRTGNAVRRTRGTQTPFAASYSISVPSSSS